MILQEKYDGMIESIERLIENGELEIPDTLSRNTGWNLRLIGDAFLFMTDMTLNQYVRQRRLVKALHTKLKSNLPIEQIVLSAGFSDAAAFSKACKKVFVLSPSQITQDILDEYEPLYFDQIAIDRSAVHAEKDVMTRNNLANNICGVTAEQFAEIKRVLEIGAVYGLNDEEAEYVYQLAKICDTTVERAAEFFEDYKLQLENGSFYGERSEFEIAKLAFLYNLSFSESKEILYELECHGYGSIGSLPKGFFDIYFSELNERLGGYDVQYICDILAAMESNEFSIDRISGILDYAEIFGIDPIELIDNYDAYVGPYEKALSNFRSEFSAGSSSI